MATQARTAARAKRTDGGRFFRNVLRTDGVVCMLLGLATAIELAWLPGIMGTGTTALYIELGIVLAAVGAFLAWLSTRTVGRSTMLAVLILTTLTALDGIILMLSGWVALTTVGFWIIAAITDITAIMAIAYYLGFRRAG